MDSEVLSIFWRLSIQGRDPLILHIIFNVPNHGINRDHWLYIMGPYSFIVRKIDAFLLHEKETVNYFGKYDTEILIQTSTYTQDKVLECIWDILKKTKCIQAFLGLLHFQYSFLFFFTKCKNYRTFSLLTREYTPWLWMLPMWDTL